MGRLLRPNRIIKEDSKMKKILAILLAGLMLLSLASCGGSPNKKAIVGTWKLVDTETETEYGLGIQFTDDGKVRYGLTEDMFGDDEDIDEALAGLDMLMTIEYEIKSDTEMELTAKALFGLASESDTVEYKLDGDTLIFDGVTYTRNK